MTLAQASAAWREHHRRCWYCRGPFRCTYGQDLLRIIHAPTVAK